MKKLFSPYLIALLAACLLIAPSCKKVYHSTNPSPTNIRLLGYTKTITKTIITPLTPTPVVTETYSFGYDNNNRLSQVLFATNDSNQFKLGLEDLRMDFSYSGGTVTRTVTNVKAANFIERDVFNLNSNGQLTSALFANGLYATEYHSYTYANLLLATETDTYSDSGTTITANSTFTSDNQDLLHQLFNGVLSASFPDSGIRPDITPVDTTRDSVLSLPLNITWTTLATIGTAGITTHNNVNSYTDQLTGYSQYEVSLNAVDPNGIFVRTAYFPAGLNTSKFFQIYDYLTNRIGDYLQLQSFTTYGVNIYQNAHLLKAMTTAFDTTTVNYAIDGQSKVTQTSVLIKDKFGNSTSIIYKLQYDTN